MRDTCERYSLFFYQQAFPIMLDKRDSKVQAKSFMSIKSETLQLYSSATCPLQPGSHSFYWGLALIISGVGSFIAFLYAAILSKLLPPSGIPLLSAIENDRYYCLLVPSTLPILVVLVYFHWLSMKLFKHA